MELMTLDANNQPSKLIENWDSLLWTERYNTVSDFQLETGDISTFMTLLPEGTGLTLRDPTMRWWWRHTRSSARRTPHRS